ERRNALYAAAVSRHGGTPMVVDGTRTPGARAAAFDTMDRLLIRGCGEPHPERYGHPDRGSTTVELDRDALEADAWQVAQARGRPVLRIFRGFEGTNRFSGGTHLP